jgi:hypothetical protein
MGLGLVRSPRVVSRRAVATLEEARRGLLKTDDSLYATAMSLPESGGTITLPDGTVIEVRRVMWADLIAEAARESGITKGMPPAEWQPRILDAYNARQA